MSFWSSSMLQSLPLLLMLKTRGCSLKIICVIHALSNLFLEEVG